MRAYGVINPTFWTRGTGKQLRGQQLPQLVALYLMSAPTSNMIGLYYLPVAAIAHELGSPLEGASEALSRVVKTGFCKYDAETETVFVTTMARRQLRLEEGEQIPERDNRRAAIEKLLKECSSRLLALAFWEVYEVQLRLSESCKPKPLGSPLEAPPKSGSGSGSLTGAEDSPVLAPVAPVDPTSTGATAPFPVPGQQQPATKRSKAKTSLPGDWTPSDPHYELGASLGMSRASVDEQAERMRDWSAAKGERCVDWGARFRNWLRKSSEGGPLLPRRDVQRSPPGHLDRVLAEQRAEGQRRAALAPADCFAMTAEELQS